MSTPQKAAVIAKGAEALFELEALGQSLPGQSELGPTDCNRFSARIHELRTHAAGLLEVLTSSSAPGRSH